jgi:integrase
MKQTFNNVYTANSVDTLAPAAAVVPYGRFHTLRHTFATRAIEINTDVKTVSETLGHTNTMITINRYTHSLKEQKQRMMDGLNAYFKGKKIATL